jgi:hypothetical protein
MNAHEVKLYVFFVCSVAILFGLSSLLLLTQFIR